MKQLSLMYKCPICKDWTKGLHGIFYDIDLYDFKVPCGPCTKDHMAREKLKASVRKVLPRRVKVKAGKIQKDYEDG